MGGARRAGAGVMDGGPVRGVADGGLGVTDGGLGVTDGGLGVWGLGGYRRGFGG